MPSVYTRVALTRLDEAITAAKNGRRLFHEHLHDVVAPDGWDSSGVDDHQQRARKWLESAKAWEGVVFKRAYYAVRRGAEPAKVEKMLRGIKGFWRRYPDLNVLQFGADFSDGTPSIKMAWYYSDETEGLNGPFKTALRAGLELEAYYREFLA